ncbi:MAG: L7Ae/L30e/S12e/Gadd45 family ribosomal protein [Bacilli bacterium]
MQDTKQTKVLNLIGLAYRAKKLVTSEKEVLNVVKTDKAKMVFVASDASLKTKDRFDKKCFYHKVPLYLDFDSDQLAHALGKSLCKIVAITDAGFTDVVQKIFMEVK